MSPLHLSQPQPTTSSRSIPSEFLCELQSAASMVMSREECEEILRELEMLRSPQPVAA